MNSTHIDRPQAEDDKISYKDRFEECYIRHRYLRKITFNPTENQMKPFKHIAFDFAKNTYYRNEELFRIVGFEMEDVVSIANIHIVNFLGLFSLKQMPSKFRSFIRLFTKLQDHRPTKKDLLDKDQANFTLFLKQRMIDLIRICRQKANNIKGMKVESYAYFYGAELPPKNVRDLLEDHEKYHFRKLAPAVFRTIRKRAHLIDVTMFDFKGCYYIAVPIDQSYLKKKDLAGSCMDPYDNIQNKNPEEVCSELEENSIWRTRKDAFDSKPLIEQIKTLKQFIKMNKDNLELEEEINTARQKLKGLKAKELNG
jgi:hypothetical protein